MQAVFYRDCDGREPVDDFIDALSPERQEEIDCTISLLNRLGPNDPPLPFPHSSRVEGHLRELRCHYGRDLYRTLYRRSRNLFVAEDAARGRATRRPEYREHQAERAAFREIAWLLIKYPMDAGLSQQELAARVGTSHSQISRIESGRHRTNLETCSGSRLRSIARSSSASSPRTHEDEGVETS